MIVLGIDTSTADAAVAVTREGDLVAEGAAGPDEGGRPRHSALLLAEVEGCVEAAGGWRRIERIGVGVGPGSYTGLRIGIATAQALAQARSLPLCGVVSLAALALGMAGHPLADARPLLPVIDARRRQVFASLHDPDGTERWPPLVATPAELGERLAELETAPLAAGDGALRFPSELEAAGAVVAPDGDAAHRVAARHVCALAEAMKPSPSGRVEPLYLRAPDAEIWLERDRGKPSW